MTILPVSSLIVTHQWQPVMIMMYSQIYDCMVQQNSVTTNSSQAAVWIVTFRMTSCPLRGCVYDITSGSVGCLAYRRTGNPACDLSVSTLGYACREMVMKHPSYEILNGGWVQVIGQEMDVGE